MSVPEQIPTNQFIIAGGEISGVWTWNLQKESELVVTKQLASTGAVVPLVLGVDYSVNALDLDDDNGGTINFLAPQLPAVAGDVWTLSRKTAIDRSPDFATSGDFLAETINEQLDELTRISQDSSLASSTAVRKDPGVGDSLDPLIPQPVTERALKFRDTGGGNFEMVMSDNDPDQQTGDAAASAAAALASEEAAAISEGAADNSASAASGFASDASTSEVNAATSETNAATSETNAATSATNAANSASGVALRFNFDDEITMVDPGASDLRFNNATLASVTQIAIDALSADAGTPDVSDFIASWDDSNNPGNKGILFIRKSGEPATFVSFKINAAITDNTGWLQIPVTFVDSNGTFTDGDEMFVQFAPAGDSTLSVTTKGDLQTFSTVPARLPVGPDGQVLVADSAETTGLRWGSGAAGKNLVINGDMRIAQRGTSEAGVGDGGGYHTTDRWDEFTTGGPGTFTYIQEALTSGNAFADGYQFAYRVDCTTADATPAITVQHYIRQKFEGRNLQGVKKGTVNANQLTVSFWVKSNQTGTGIVNLIDQDNSRAVAGSYTIDTTNTWEFKTITFAADSSGVLDDDNNVSLDVRWWIGAGTNFTSGTLPSAWESTVNANLAVGNAITTGTSTANDFAITGAQLEIGSSATEFERRQAEVEIALCRRYFERFPHGSVLGSVIAPINVQSTTLAECPLIFISKRANPTFTVSSPTNGHEVRSGTGVDTVTSMTFNTVCRNSVQINAGVASGLVVGESGFLRSKGASDFLDIDAEL